MKLVKISEVKPNPKNPRIIKDGKFHKLVKSIKEFPDMLNKRPLIVFTDVDDKYVVLGGNMRLKALKELNYKEVPVIVADEWTEEQKAEFLIKDNVGYGEWDWDSLANEWDVKQLADWGMDIPTEWGLNLDELGDSFSLPDGDKAPFQQMTFTLADAQAERIKEALKAVTVQDGTQYGNENSNGNALHQIVLEWAEQRI